MIRRACSIVALIILTLSFTTWAQTGCQNQLCSVGENGCFVCSQGGGSYCIPQHNKCAKECTWGICGSAKPRFISGWRSGAFNAQTCILPTAIPSSHGGTNIGQIALDGEPASIKAATHGSEDLFIAGVLVNKVAKDLVSFRIGWVAVYDGHATTIQRGQEVILHQALRESKEAKIPRQHTGKDMVVKAKNFAHSKVVFFLADATFGDGSRYTVGNETIKRAAEKEPTNEQVLALNLD